MKYLRTQRNLYKFGGMGEPFTSIVTDDEFDLTCLDDKEWMLSDNVVFTGTRDNPSTITLDFPLTHHDISHVYITYERQ